MKKYITNPTKAKGILTGPSQSRRRRIWSGSAKQTQKLGEKFAEEILVLREIRGKNNSAVVFGLQGNLGGGKTTFLQGFARGLGIKEKILSPTFVIYKKFSIFNFQFSINSQLPIFKNFYHFDCYRINKSGDVLELGFKEIIKNPENIVAIEWPEKIKKVLPKNTIYIEFKFINEKEREIIFKK